MGKSQRRRSQLAAGATRAVADDTEARSKSQPPRMSARARVQQQRREKIASRLRRRFDERGEAVLNIAERLARARDEPECQRLIEMMHALIGSSAPSSSDLQKVSSGDGLGDAFLPACLITPPEVLERAAAVAAAGGEGASHLSSSSDIASLLEAFDAPELNPRGQQADADDEVAAAAAAAAFFDPCALFLRGSATPAASGGPSSSAAAPDPERRAPVRAAVLAVRSVPLDTSGAQLSRKALPALITPEKHSAGGARASCMAFGARAGEGAFALPLPTKSAVLSPGKRPRPSFEEGWGGSEASSSATGGAGASDVAVSDLAISPRLGPISSSSTSPRWTPCSSPAACASPAPPACSSPSPSDSNSNSESAEV